MRVLHIANFSWFSAAGKRADNLARYYASDRKISNGLIRNGHCVWEVSYRDAARYLSPLAKNKGWGSKSMNAALIPLAEEFSAELILLGHCELVTPQTLAALRQKLPAVKIAQWWVDWFPPRALSQLRQKQPHLDAFFSTTAPEYLAPLLNSATPLHYIPNMVDSSVETARAFECDKYQYDVFFAGSKTPARAAVLSAIENMPGVRHGFFGFGKRPFLGGAEFVRALAKSKIGLNLSQATDIPLYSSDRLAQLAGNGVAVLAPATPHMTSLFAEDEVCYFANAQQLPAALRDLLGDERRRLAVARAGWRRSHESYNEKRVTQFMVEAASGRPLAETYEWLKFSRI